MDRSDPSALGNGRQLLCAAMSCAVVIAFAAVFLGASPSAQGALPCGPRPDIVPANLTPQLKDDIQDTANLFHHAPSRSDLRRFVTAERRELRQKYPDVEKPALDSYLIWTTCQTIARDPAVDAAQGFDEYAHFYRLLTEPIDKAASNSE